MKRKGLYFDKDDVVGKKTEGKDDSSSTSSIDAEKFNEELSEVLDLISYEDENEESGSAREIKITLAVPKDENEKDSKFTEAINIVRLGISSILRRWFFILAIFIVFFGASILVAFYVTDRNRPHTGFVRAIIRFDFIEAEEGLDPLGMPLNFQMMRSPYVIGRAMDVAEIRHLGIAPETIRSNFHVRPVTPHDVINRFLIVDQLRPAQRLGELEELVLHPTEFYLRMYRRGALDALTDQDMTNLLNAIISEYQAYFARAYNDIAFLDVIVGYVDHSRRDFSDLISISRTAINDMVSYVEYLRGLSPNFRSPSTGRTFGDVSRTLDLIMDVDINRLAALIHVENISRDHNMEAAMLEYEVHRLRFDYLVLRMNEDDAIFLIRDVYTQEQWFMGHMAEYIFRHRQVHDELIRYAYYYTRLANELYGIILYNEARIEALRRGETNPVYQAHQSTPEQIAFIESGLEGVFVTLEMLENEINVMVNDFFEMELFRDAIRVQTPGGFVTVPANNIQQITQIVLAGSAVGLFFGIIISLYRGMIYDRTKIVRK